MSCQATKRIFERRQSYIFPLGSVRCGLSENHDGEHEGDHDLIDGSLRWKRGKQHTPHFIVEKKGTGVEAVGESE